MKTVHLVFKTHFDYGFTDLAETVLHTYVERHIPRALRLARQLRLEGVSERFVWTTGSWLIYEFLERSDPAGRAEMEAGIEAGDIAWHALPFTTHSELMSASLFRFGLGLSRELDRRFGRTTLAAKMTDVPGHTRAIVPLLEEAGVRFLHIGVNPASPAPTVPDLFRWRDPEGHELVVNYTRGGYGNAFSRVGMDSALVFAHSGDNGGPQDRTEVAESHARARRQFPDAEVQASTLDAFARELLLANPVLPVVETEIGDTWIHGVGTDPQKTALFRRLDRATAHWEEAELDTPERRALNACRRELLCVPEHTWGLDEKTHLGDYVNYARADFEAARKRDRVDAAPPEGMESFGAFRLNAEDETSTITTSEGTYSRFESSWKEQRDFLDRAIAKLSPVLRDKAAAIRDGLVPRPPARAGRALEFAAPFRVGSWRCRLDEATGAVIELTDTRTGHCLATADHPLFRLSYQTFSAEDYARWLDEYNVNMDEAWCWSWAVPDFGKPGMERADSPSRIWPYRLREAWLTSEDECLLFLEGDAKACATFGAPSAATVQMRCKDGGVDLALQWFDKPANRMAEAVWLAFQPGGIAPDTWRMSKMGRWVSPLDVVEGGNRNLHAVEGLVARTHSGAVVQLDTPDAPLVSPGDPRLLRFDNEQPALENGVHINLYNNIWGTNFPMWYEEDARFEFRLRIRELVPRPA